MVSPSSIGNSRYSTIYLFICCRAIPSDIVVSGVIHAYMYNDVCSGWRDRVDVSQAGFSAIVDSVFQRTAYVTEITTADSMAGSRTTTPTKQAAAVCSVEFIVRAIGLLFVVVRS